MKRKGKRGNRLGFIVLACMLMFTGCGSGDSASKGKDAKDKANILINDQYIIDSKDTEDDSKYGLIDKEGKVIMDYKYDYLSFDSSTGQFFATKNGKKGIINEKEEVIIPIIYEDVFGKADAENYMFTDFEKTYVIDTNGKIKKTYDYDFVYKSQKNTYLVSNKVTKDEYGQLTEKNYGLLDKDGKELLACKYDYMTSIYSYSKSKRKFEEVSYYTEEDGKSGVFDLTGNVIIPLEYDNPIDEGDGVKKYPITYSDATQSYLVRKNNQYGVINRDGKLLIDSKYDQIYGYSDGYLALKDGEETYFDRKGKEAIPKSDPLYSDFEDLKDKEVLKIGSFDENGNAIVILGSDTQREVALINKKGKFIIDPIQTTNSIDGIYFLGAVDEGFYELSLSNFFQNEKFGCTDYVYYLRNQSNDVTGIVLYDKNGKKLGTYEGNSLGIVSEDLYELECYQNDKETALYGLINRKGNVIVEAVYDDILVYDDYIKAVKDGKKYLLDLEDGKEVLSY